MKHSGGSGGKPFRSVNGSSAMVEPDQSRKLCFLVAFRKMRGEVAERRLIEKVELAGWAARRRGSRNQAQGFTAYGA